MEFFDSSLTAIIIFVASFFATVSGFGFALVATPLLCLVVPLKTAIVFVLVLTIWLRVLTMYQVWGKFDWNTVILTVLGSFVGMVPGSVVLRIISLEMLELLLGSLLLAATYLMGKDYTVPIRNKTWGRLGAGVLSGFFGAATSVSGPPLVLYFLNEHTDKDTMRANMIWIFGIGGFLMVLASYWAGNISAVEDWQPMLLMMPATLLGVILGERMFYHLNQHLFRRMSLCIVLVGAVMMLINGARALI